MNSYVEKGDLVLRNAGPWDNTGEYRAGGAYAVEKIRVLIAEDQALLRDGLKTLLSLEHDMIIVDTAKDGRAAVEKALETRPDVVLMDVRMPYVDGLTCSREIRQKLPSTKIIILSVSTDDVTASDALKAGASGFLLKDVDTSRLVSAIRQSNAGFAVFQTDTALLDDKVGHLQRKLAPREWDILELMGRGLTNREIADQLHLSEGTVKNRATSLFTKLGVRNRIEAILLLNADGKI